MFVQESTLLLSLPAVHVQKGQMRKSFGLQPSPDSNASPLTSKTVVKLPITTIGFRSSSVAWLVQQVLKDFSSFSSRTTLGSMSIKLQRAASFPCKRLLPPRTCHNSASTAAASHSVRIGHVGSARGLANSAPLHLRPFFVFLEERALRSTAAATAALAHGHVRSWRHITFPPLG